MLHQGDQEKQAAPASFPDQYKGFPCIQERNVCLPCRDAFLFEDGRQTQRQEEICSREEACRCYKEPMSRNLQNQTGTDNSILNRPIQQTAPYHCSRIQAMALAMRSCPCWK